MKTSVIVPCYNHQKYVKKCLNSILDNCNDSLELLICDDCSSDNTSLEIDEWLKKTGRRFERVVFIKHKTNHGITNSLNELISECRGELISPLASDDYYLEGAIIARQSALCSNPHWLGAFSDGIAVDLNDVLYTNSILSDSGIENHSLSPENINNTIIQRWVEPMNLQFWRRSAFKSHGGEFEFDKSVFCEDLNFAIWAVAKNAFGYLDHKCVAYRCRTWPQSTPDITASTKRKKLLDMAFIYGKAANAYHGPMNDYLVKKSEYHMAVACENYVTAAMLESYLKKGISPTFMDKLKFRLFRK